MAEERTVWVRIKAVMDEFNKGFKQGLAEMEAESKKTSAVVTKNFAGLEKGIQNFGKGVGTVGKYMSASLTPALTLIAKKSIDDFRQAQQAVADMEAALKSTGNTAGLTSAELQKWAGDAQFKSLYQDEEILKDITANLLTFKSVGKDVFFETQQAAIDMSARLGQDLQSSTIQLGKALNDPVKGLTALRRVGIQFTESQKDQIEAMVEANDLLGAQKLILKEVQSQFAGSAEAQRNAGGGGAIDDFNKNMGELRETWGGILQEVITPFIAKLNELLQWFRQLSPETQKMVVGIAGIAAALGPVMMVLGPIISAFSALAPVLGALASPIGLFIAAIAGISIALNEFGITFEQQWNAIVVLFTGVVEQLKMGVQLLKQLFSGDLTGAFQTFQQMWTNMWTILAETVNTLFPGLIESITGFFQQMWQNITAATANIVLALQQLGTQAIEAVAAMVTGIADWITNKLSAIWDSAVGKIQAVGDAFQSLYMRVVGGSIIPDMVNEIGGYMQTLDQNLVAPAQEATSEVGSLFQGLAGTVKSYISEFIKTGKFDIQGFIADISSQLIDWGLDMLMKNLLGGFMGGGGGGIGGLLGGLFAEGGQPPLNKPSIVGEKGPELFIPKRMGTVVSNKRSQEMLGAAGEGGTSYSRNTRQSVMNVNVYAKDVDSFKASESSIGRRMKRMADMGQRGA